MMNVPFRVCALGALAGALLLTACGDGEQVQSPIDVTLTEVGDIGLDRPGAVIHDPVDDVYLVSNMSGTPGDRDGEGFISRVSPEGEALDANWIQLFGPDLALNSPRGMALRGDTVFVADLDCVRLFDRVEGSATARVCLDGATFLSDVDVGPEGSIFAADSGLELGDNGLEASGSDAVYRVVLEEGRRGSTLARDPELGRPSGLAVGTRGIFVTTWDTGEIFRLTPQGERTDVIPASGRRFDGIVFLPDGGFAYTSSSESSVFLVTAEGQVFPLLEDVPEPGSPGYDAQRDRLLIPLTGENRILFVDLPEDTDPT